MGKPFSITTKKLSELLETSTIREFDGGLNVVDNDLNLSTRFSKVETNVYRGVDGSKAIRFGTKKFLSINDQDDVTGTLTNAFKTVATSYVITVTHANHGMISGHKITFSLSGNFDGIPAADINKEHVVIVNNANEYAITVASPATAGLTGGGTVNYVINNFEINSDIVHITYFSNSLVYFCKNGEIGYANGQGLCVNIWNTAIAQTQSGSPAAWSDTSIVSSAVFKGKLVACNGIDKPLIIDLKAAIPCQYMADVTGSNLNTPICKYVAVTNHYMIMAGDINAKSTVYISNRDTCITWYGDPAPNDAVNIDLGVIATSNNQEIKGLSVYRDNIVVAFDDCLVIGKLGTYESAVHVPNFEDVIEQYGSLSHRSIVSIGNDLLMADKVGVPSLSRTTISNSIRPERVSQLIDPLIQDAFTILSDLTLEERVWAIYNQVDGQYMLFIPNNDDEAATTETVCYTYTSNPTLKVNAWSEFRGWNFSCGCITALKRVVLCEGKTIYLYGNRANPIFRDLLDIDGTGGQAYTFDWELPWSDFKRRNNIKKTRYVALDVKGTGDFSLDMYVDNCYYDASTGARTPELTMDFRGGDVDGFGGVSPYYGGGRRTSDERLYAWTSEFKIAKLRFHGTVTGSLNFIAIGLLFLRGSIRR